MLTWLPFYLVRERHLSMQSMAKVASAYYAIEGLSAITTGWFSDFFIRRSYTPTLVRKSAMAIGHTIAAIALVGCAMATSLAPALTGLLVGRTGKFLAPLAIAAAVLVAGGLAWVFAVGPVEQVSWETESSEAPVATASF
jgi:ACS family D-galactonate transporter-like MFS transporter